MEVPAAAFSYYEACRDPVFGIIMVFLGTQWVPRLDP